MFRKSRISLVVSLSLLLILGLVVGNVFAAGKKVTLTFWQTMNTDETKNLAQIVKEFEKANPGIKINMQTVPFAQAQNKFKTAAQAGDAPDVFRCEIAWTPEMAALGYLSPLDKLVSKADLADYLAAPLNYNKYNGKLWGIPQVTDCLALLYNKRLFKEAGVNVPKTMDEFVKVAKKLTKADGSQYGFGLNPDSYWYQAFMWAYGGDLINAKTKKVLVNNAASVKALQFMIDLKDKYGVTPKEMDFMNGYNNAMTGFKDGKYAMIMNGPWSTADVLTGKEFKDKANLGIAVIPKGPAGYGSPVGGHNYVISRNCKKVDAAYKFISFINQAKYQAVFANKNNLLPTRRSAYALKEVKNNPLIAGFKGQLEVAKNRPVIPEGGQIYTAFTPEIQAALKGQKKPKEALDAVAKAWNTLLGN